LTESSSTERLQVVLARHGVASRRGVVEIIESGQIKVNGSVVHEKGFRVDPIRDKIEYQGKLLSAEKPAHVYYLYNKPAGVTTTLSDPHAKDKVSDYFKDVPERVFPVGRLDRETTGVLLLTNDGELSFRLAHPRYGVDKTYFARVMGIVTEDKRQFLQEGVELEEGLTAPCKVEIEQLLKNETELVITLHEGKKRQIRRMLELIGNPVIKLERIQYGTLSLEGLLPGQRRLLEPDEVRALKKLVGLENA
jgi:pseudouridine synthase